MSAVPRGRSLLLLGGGLGLAVGLWSGLARAGVHRPIGPLMEHGIVMVLGFLGTLIALERAVGLGRRWAYLAPGLGGASAVTILIEAPRQLSGAMLTVAGTIVIASYVALLRVHRSDHLVIMAAGAGAWVAAAALWTAGWSPPTISPLLAAFLVLTIVGERLELSRFRAPTGRARQPLLVAVTVFAVGAGIAVVHRPTGLITAGLGLLAQTAWLVRHDLARATIHRTGVTRYAAACMLAGYVWLGASGLLWIALGLPIHSPLLYDAALHTIFLGFAISMVMGHAPIILPAVLRVPLPYRPVAWLPLGLLHLSVAARVTADLVGSTWARGWTVHGNTAAILLFIATCLFAIRRGSRGPDLPHRSPTAPATPTTVGVATPPGVLP